ncbi:hypothetical protein Tco_0500097 [Tanacetum coccineum]
MSIPSLRPCDLDNSTSNVLIPLDSWTSGLLVYRLPLSGSSKQSSRALARDPSLITLASFASKRVSVSSKWNSKSEILSYATLNSICGGDDDTDGDGGGDDGDGGGGDDDLHLLRDGVAVYSAMAALIAYVSTYGARTHFLGVYIRSAPLRYNLNGQDDGTHPG